jgi:hypothetical protein
MNVYNVIPGTLGGLAALHAAWALGWRWPGGSDRELAERVVGPGAELPSPAMIWSVAGVLTVAAVSVRAGAQGRVRIAAWTVAAVLTARGLAAIPVALAGGLGPIYNRLDLALYSPLCLALGLGTARMLRRS